MLQPLRQLLKKLTAINPDIDREVDEILDAIGGLGNISQAGACATRLRLTLHDTALVDSTRLKQQGAIGVVILDKHNVQIIYGMKANSYSQLIEQRL